MKCSLIGDPSAAAPAARNLGKAHMHDAGAGTNRHDWRGLYRQLGEAVIALRALPAVRGDATAQRLVEDIAAAPSMEEIARRVGLLRLHFMQTGALKSSAFGSFVGALSRAGASSTAAEQGFDDETSCRRILRI